MRRSKWALVGCGRHAFDAHFPAIVKIPEIELVAVCDAHEPTAQLARERFGAAKVYTNHKDLLRDENVDTIDVVTPSGAHASVVVDSAEAGKNVVCEKPMANDLKECDAMIAAARKNSIKFMVAHSRRFWRKYMHIKSVVEDGTLGSLLVMKSLEVRPKDRNIQQEHYFRSETDPLGSILGKGGHSVDLFRWFAKSNLKRVFAVGKATKGLVYPGSDVFDHAKAMFVFENGSVGFIEAGDVAPRACPYYFPILEVVGTRGRINASDYSMVSVFASYDQNVFIPFSEKQFLSGVGTPFYDELRYFAKCVLEDMEPSFITPEDGRAVVEAAIAANMSMRRGEPVSLPLA